MSSIEDYLSIPKDISNYANFSAITRKNIISLFNLDNSEAKISLIFFENNGDHGIHHVYAVRKKSLYISDVIEKETEESVDRNLLYAMVLAHDSGRSHVYAPDDRITPDQVLRKEKNNDRKHSLYGTAQVRFAVRLLRKKGINMDSVKLGDLQDYVYNHDYLNDHLSGGRYVEPSSLEGQIARLADRVSESVLGEVKRYRETGKRMGTPYFIADIPLSARKDFHFGRVKEYAAKGWLDQCMFFGALLSIKPQDFSHPILERLYKNWELDKKDAVDYIIQEACTLGYDQKRLEKLYEVITYYADIYDFTDVLGK